MVPPACLRAARPAGRSRKPRRPLRRLASEACLPEPSIRPTAGKLSRPAGRRARPAGALSDRAGPPPFPSPAAGGGQGGGGRARSWRTRAMRKEALLLVLPFAAAWVLVFTPRTGAG